MSSILKQQKRKTLFVIFLFLFSYSGFAQIEEDVLRFELGFGLNQAFNNGYPETFSSKGLNLPTINVGAQYMFTEQLGAKFDLGFNRLKGEGSTDDFKINYTRLNLQGVYDYTHIVGLHEVKKLKFQAHAGPGFSFVRPMSIPYNNDQNFFNAIIGSEFLYRLNQNSSVFFDVSYIHGFTSPDSYLYPSEGLGAFNGSILTFTIGISLSLSGCYYCN
ncbi:outer membrane beta-barrel protein [Formosa sediminum]|uniref:Outer membrane beta-barrel protein n=1 Tax=Formosa sediminum TaxID=2594004 RepID=A0A516GQ43_9FLAO|nr:outer membrane beta-barrel protein [Formosa sediminum]QDO93648.1 outer membrane beta-barrel protein [Formosa sediminum]